jgi:acetolactate synthase-1/2/3 large subunit
MTAVEWFVKALRERGVDWMATLCGHGLDPLFHAAKTGGIRLVDARNEQTAGYMAEAYGRLTRRPGVSAVSSGVAHVNALSGVADAWIDGAPMLLISGAGNTVTAGMGHFQDLDQVALASPVSKYARTIDPAERAIEMLDEAWRTAASAPPGPVHLTFPMDVQRTEVTGMMRPAAAVPQAVPAAEEVDLAQYERPLIVAGSGVWYACEGDALLNLSEEFGIPVVAPIWDRGSIERPSSTFMGVTGAASGGPNLLHDADCIIMAGAVPDYRVHFLQPGPVRDNARVVYGWKGVRGGKSH